MPNREAEIARSLVAQGKEILDRPRPPVKFTGIEDADLLLNDLKQYPHAFLFGCLVDRQMKAERAWLIPYLISKKIGGFEFAQLKKLSRAQVVKLVSKPEPLHRFSATVAGHLYEAIQRLEATYDGDASRIWRNRPSSAMVAFRFLEFAGIGPKIATMAANLLAREFKVPLADYYSIDVSADVHVRRVFTRLGLVESKCSMDEIIYRARGLHPEFPGLLDQPCWMIGRTWCKPINPRCGDCCMRGLCPVGAKVQPSSVNP